MIGERGSTSRLLAISSWPEMRPRPIVPHHARMEPHEYGGERLTEMNAEMDRYVR